MPADATMMTTIKDKEIIESSKQEDDDVDKAKDVVVHPFKKGRKTKRMITLSMAIVQMSR
eukprot:14660439-Ditylum_brightwellii.AAC.1